MIKIITRNCLKIIFNSKSQYYSLPQKYQAYVYSSIFNHNPDRPKKLLLHREQIKRLQRKVEEKGYTLIPLSFYLKDGRLKVSLGICKGKKQFDKRNTIKDRDNQRDIQREFRKGLKG